MARLVCTHGANQGVCFEINEQTVIGRGSDADIICLDPKVSREHCEIILQGKEYFIRDMESRNGTFVEEEEINERQPLRFEQKIIVGNSVFTLTDKELLTDSRRLPRMNHSDIVPVVHSEMTQALSEDPTQEGNYRPEVLTEIDINLE